MTEHAPEYLERQPVIFTIDRICSGKVETAAPPPVSRELINMYFKAFSAIPFIFPCLKKGNRAPVFETYFSLKLNFQAASDWVGMLRNM